MTQPANRRLVTEDRFLVTEAEAAAAYDAVTSIASLSPNYIINGGMDIWQRGTSFSLAGSSMSYTADRWMAWTGAGLAATVSRQAGPTGIRYCARVQRNSGNTATTDYNFSQPIETPNSIQLAGSSVTFSFWLRVGANFSSTSIQATIASGTGTDQNQYVGFTGGANIASSNITPTTSWQKFSITGTVGSSVTQLGVLFKLWGAGTAGAADYFEVTGVQLEAGSVATAFRRNANSIQGELAACQRYTCVIGAGAIGRALSTTLAQFGFTFPVEMRTTPVSGGVSLTSSISFVEMNVSARTGTSINTFDNASTTGLILTLVSSGLSVPNMCAVTQNKILVSAEL